MGINEKRVSGGNVTKSFHRLACTFLCSLAGMAYTFAIDNGMPKLVVGIMIDQLRTDVLEQLKENFGENGFNRLINQGLYLTDVDFKVPVTDPVSSTAIVYTGSYPRYNGVTSSKVYSPATKEMVSVLHDPNAIGNFTTETYSPANIRISTLGDEIAVSGAGSSSVYSISPDAQQSIIMAGHAGKSAFWINENSGNWASTTYYLDNPQLLTLRNYNTPIAQRIDTMVWKPLDGTASFAHRFPSSDRNVFRMFANSPKVNEEVTEAATAYLKELGIGKNGNGPDMLNIAYTVAPYNYDGDPDINNELTDSYLRLDKELEKLFNSLSVNIGWDNVLLFVSSTGYFEDDATVDPKYRIPTGTFSVKRAMSLLNSYLAAQFGNGSFVDRYSDKHVFLNRKEIEERNLRLDDVAELSRDFLVKMSGVSDAYTMADIMSSSLPSMEGLRLATDPKTGGDIILEFNPGWKVTDDTIYPPIEKTERATIALTPAFILGKNIEPKKVEETVEATAIAPTVSRLLRIRAPNGAESKPFLVTQKTTK